MAQRLGQVLIDRGLITATQLELALRNQLSLGGHLGTSLLELGMVDEKHLGKILADTLQVPYAGPKMFRRVPVAVVRALPKRVVAEYRAVPFRGRGKTLDVAMINPSDLPAIDALAFASGCKISPWVSPEVRIFEAMDKLYDIPREIRYIVISRSLGPGG